MSLRPTQFSVYLTFSADWCHTILHGVRYSLLYVQQYRRSLLSQSMGLTVGAKETDNDVALSPGLFNNIIQAAVHFLCSLSSSRQEAWVKVK